MAVPLEKEVAEVYDDDAVDQKYNGGGKGGITIIVVQFNGHVNARGDNCEPFGPGVLVPEAIALGEPDGGQGERDDGDQSKPGIRDLFGLYQEHPRVVPGGIEMQDMQDSLGEQTDILVDEGKGAETNGQEQHALEQLKAGDGAQAERRLVVGAGVGQIDMCFLSLRYYNFSFAACAFRMIGGDSFCLKRNAGERPPATFPISRRLAQYIV